MQADTAINGRLGARQRSERMVRPSLRIWLPSGTAKAKRRMPAAMLMSSEYATDIRSTVLVDPYLLTSSCSATMRETATLMPDVAKVTTSM